MADIITLEEYKTYKGIGKVDQDEKISFVIKSVSDLIKAYCGQSIVDNWETPIVEEITIPYDTNLLYLNAYPIRDIVSVEEVTGGWIAGLDSTVHYPAIFNSDYVFNSSSGLLTRLGRNWSRTVKVTYRAGYQVVPTQLKMAAIELVSYYLNEDWKPNRTMQGANMAGPAPEAGGIPKHILPMLNHYKVGL